MFKIIIGSAEIGGNLQYQRDIQKRAALDLEDALNKFPAPIEDVVAVTSHAGDHDFQLIAVVKVREAVEAPAQAPAETPATPVEGGQ